MRSFIILPILMVGMLIQTAVLGNFSLLSGKVDLLLLILISWNIHKDALSNYLWAIFAAVLFTIYSSVPIFLPFGTFLLITYITRKINAVTFHMPIFLLIYSTLIGSAVNYGVYLAQIWLVSGFQADVMGMIWSIVIPSLFLNLIFALPVNSIIKEFVKISDPDVEIQ